MPALTGCRPYAGSGPGTLPFLYFHRLVCSLLLVCQHWHSTCTGGTSLPSHPVVSLLLYRPLVAGVGYLAGIHKVNVGEVLLRGRHTSRLRFQAPISGQAGARQLTRKEEPDLRLLAGAGAITGQQRRTLKKALVASGILSASPQYLRQGVRASRHDFPAVGSLAGGG